MKDAVRLMALFPVLFAAAAHADPMPPEALQKDYDNCMGGEDPQQDPRRAQYCDCVRQQISHWSTDQYGQVAAQAKENAQQTPDAIEQIARVCMNEALH